MDARRHRPRNVDMLSVKDRVDAVLQLHQHEDPLNPLSVAEVCRRSRVNRANLYATYPELVAQILRRPIGARANSKPPSSLQELMRCDAQDVETRVQVKALLYICLELRAEVEKLQAAVRDGVHSADKKAIKKSRP